MTPHQEQHAETMRRRMYETPAEMRERVSPQAPPNPLLTTEQGNYIDEYSEGELWTLKYQNQK